jgi:hypothetical protein
MLTLECAKCGERQSIAPVNPNVPNVLEDMEIFCDVCGTTGKPKFVITACDGGKRGVKH